MLADVLARELAREGGDGRQALGAGKSPGSGGALATGDALATGEALFVGGGVGAEGASAPVLDAGCGEGGLALELAYRGVPVIAADVSGPRLRRAAMGAVGAGLADRVAFVRADLTRLPLRDACVGGAVAGEVLEHVDDHERAAHELARVMMPGAAIALTVPAGPERFGPGDRRAGHRRRYDRDGLTSLLRGAGLEPSYVRGWGFPFGRLYDRWVQRPALASRGPWTRSALAALGGSRAAHWLWSRLFALDAHVRPGERGSGWLAVARKPR